MTVQQVQVRRVHPYRKFMPHQVKAMAFLKKLNGCAGLYMACGTGKTLVVARYARFRMPALIICRRDDYFTWQKELALEGVPGSDVFLLQNARQELPLDPRWAIITYGQVRNARIFRWIRHMLWKVTAADESHTIKRWKAQRTKKVIAATRHIPHRIAMTGTPITNTPGDVYTQSLFVDNGRTFGNNWWKFKKKYYIQSGPGWYLKHNSKDLIANKLSKMSFYVHEDDVLNLPPVRRLTKSVRMSGQQRHLYRKIWSDFDVVIPGRKIVELNHVISQCIKSRQIASGFIYDENHKAIWMKSPKLDLLLSMLKDEDYFKYKEKIVIWCAHSAEIFKITSEAKALGVKSVTFGGHLDPDQKIEARQRFEGDKAIKLFIGQVDAGVGMNELVVADTAVYFSNSSRVVSRQQSELRIRRKGSEGHKSITYWDFVSEDSIDVTILEALRQNISLADYITARINMGDSLSRILNLVAYK